jgi:division/cell wall cluster transcriptional repressor MraZ
MFIGEYAHNLDDKGRLAIPIKFRDFLKKGAVVTRGLDNCLFLYTRDEWKILAERLAQLPISQANTRAFARLMLAGAMDVDIVEVAGDEDGKLTEVPVTTGLESDSDIEILSGLSGGETIVVLIKP